MTFVRPNTVVTIFLSNDATAVVLTPAVAAVVKTAKADRPLPYLFICAFTANAASFVLPISNPANLVIYGSHMPPLLQWLPRYALPSLLSIAATYVVLRWSQRKDLRQDISAELDIPALSAAGKMSAFGIAATAIVLLVSSGRGIQLGLPTVLAGLGTAILVLTRSKCGMTDIAKNISWDVLPLVAGLFVLVESLEKTGVTRAVSDMLQHLVRRHGPGDRSLGKRPGGRDRRSFRLPGRVPDVRGRSMHRTGNPLSGHAGDGDGSCQGGHITITEQIDGRWYGHDA